MPEKRVVITGASGLLGRAMSMEFRKSGWTVLGLAFSRASGDLIRVDLCNHLEIEKILEDFKPSCVIHCAAQRFPDKVERDLEATIKLNVDATNNLACLCAKAGITMLYISTDYVFDGTSPPYSESDTPNPLNTYGKTKLQGEIVTLKASEGHIVLRIPILYGTVEYLGESAITVLLELLFKTDPTSISDYEIRSPVHVGDLAAICVHLLELKLSKPESVQGIYQWGGEENMTKFGMVKVMSEVFNLSMTHVSPDPNPVPGANRPYNAQLSNAKLQALGVGKHTPFRDGIEVALRSWVERRRVE